MSISKRKHFLPLTVTGIAMAAGVLYLAVYLAAGIPEEQREYQEIVSFGKTVYDQKITEGSAEDRQGWSLLLRCRRFL